METQHLSLQTRFVQTTPVSQNEVSNNIEWHEKYWFSMYIYLYIYIHIRGLECGVVISFTMSWLAALPNRRVIDNKYYVMVY